MQIEASTVEIEERGVKLRLTVVDTPGYGDAINCRDWYVHSLSVITCRSMYVHFVFVWRGGGENNYLAHHFLMG